MYLILNLTLYIYMSIYSVFTTQELSIAFRVRPENSMKQIGTVKSQTNVYTSNIFLEVSKK